jgi:transcriptional regulator with XRE-family HTH domain
MKTFGAKLRDLRSKKNLSLDELAHHLELSKTSISKWESDLSKPSTQNFLKICEFFEVEVYDLVENVSNLFFKKLKFESNDFIINNPNNSSINYISNEETLKNIVTTQNQLSDLLSKQAVLITKLSENLNSSSK